MNSAPAPKPAASGWNLLDRNVLLVTGKGGVGKSAVTAGLARLAASRGKRVLWVEHESVSRAAPLFGRTTIGPEPVTLAPNLQAVTLDAEASLQFFVVHQLRVKALAQLALRNQAVRHFFQAVPAMKPILFLFQLWRFEVEHGHRGDRRWDLVICDLPTSGFVSGMYAIPQTLAGVFRLGPIAEYARDMAAMLGDPRRTGLVLVTLPEELPVVETLELREALRQKHGVEAAALIVNAMPRSMDAAALDAAAELLSDSPWLWPARTWQDRHARAETWLQRARAALVTPTWVLPLLHRRDLPLEAVDALASALDEEGA